MKPREQGGVVDERLNVYGVQNLKIAGNCPTTFFFGKTGSMSHPSLQTAASHRVMWELTPIILR